MLIYIDVIIITDKLIIYNKTQKNVIKRFNSIKFDGHNLKI